MNRKQLIAVFLSALFLCCHFFSSAEAQSGCCSSHGGVCGNRCCDGSALSAACGGASSTYSPRSSSATSGPALVSYERSTVYSSSSSEPTFYEHSTPYSSDSNSEETFIVCRVVDGDTLELCNGKKIRLIGIDTPEKYDSDKLDRDAQRTGDDAAVIQEMGKRASDFTRQLCDSKQVRLEYDVTKNDKYGRTLAYVYLNDGTFVNAKIIKQGYASPMTIPPNVKYADLFSKLYEEARENKRGLWKDE